MKNITKRERSGFLLVEMIIALVLIGALTSFVLPLVGQIGRQQQLLSEQANFDLVLMNVVAFVHAEPGTADWQNDEWLEQRANAYSERLAGQVDDISLMVNESDVSPNQQLLAVRVIARRGAGTQEKTAEITTWIASLQEEPNE